MLNQSLSVQSGILPTMNKTEQRGEEEDDSGGEEAGEVVVAK
jgi:hypothetical protein